MSINFAILGILSWKPMTGYDLKKIIQESTFMYWSANNNQIYKSLVELVNDGYVTYEVQHQESSPSKKVYTITEEGMAELKKWVLTTPQGPEWKKSFLIQLAWADQLNQTELNSLLTEYESQIKMQIVALKERKRRGSFFKGRTERETHIWEMIQENIMMSYEAELEWLQRFQSGISSHNEEIIKIIKHFVHEENSQRYIEFVTAENKISTEQDAVDLIAICGESDTNRMLLHAEMLSDDFYRLETGVAGRLLQKFVNYQMKTAVVIPSGMRITARFKEFMAETNKGNAFRIFTGQIEAKDWLIR